MEIKANLNYLRIAPRKVRLIADLIRGMNIKEAETQLKFSPKRATQPLLKLLNSSVANAQNNFNLGKDVLYIKKIIVNEGPPFKRWRAGSRGRALPVSKRTSHISLVLAVKPGVRIEKPSKVKSEVKPEEIKEIKGEEKAKPKPPKRAPREIKKPESKSLFKKIFRRKSF